MESNFVDAVVVKDVVYGDGAIQSKDHSAHWVIENYVIKGNRGVI